MNKWAKISAVLIGLGGLALWFNPASFRPTAITTPAHETITPRSAQPIITNNPTMVIAKSPQEIIAEFGKSGAPKLSGLQIELYLKEKNRGAESLLAAYRLSQDPTYLKEAVKNFADNPAVQLEAALRAPTAEERREGIEAFKKLSPDNPLGNYLQADLAFTQGDYASAAQVLSTNLSNGTLPDFSAALFQNTESAYLSAGYTPIESKIAALFAFNEDRVRSLTSLQNVSDNLTTLRNQFIQQGDIDAAEPTVQMEITLGQHIQNQVNPALLNALVGQAIERRTLASLDPSTPLGANNETAQSRLAELSVKGQEINVLLNSLQAYPIESMSPDELNQYTQHVQQEGEIGALRWWTAQKSVPQK
jgi:hypothetical protein